MGYKKLIATPHINNLFPDNNPEKLLHSFYQIAQETNRSRFEVKLGIAAEYMLDSGFEKHLLARNLLTLDDRIVLIEFPTFQAPPNIEEVLFELQLAGYKPMLAHPERYSFFHSDLTKYEKLKELGCLFQLNLLSLAPNQNDHVRNSASKLLNCDWYEYVGTDIHSPDQLKYLSKIKLRHSFSNNELL
ncbi:MAG: histidinol phosphatase [Saprospiraceae bacterium]|nr:histidinol phosphatase [Saprospiraceae bacterium]